jgi:hypothetical protein
MMAMRHGGEIVSASLLVDQVDDESPHRRTSLLTSLTNSRAWFQDGFVNPENGFVAGKTFRRGILSLRVQALLDVGGAIPRQHLRRVGLARTIKYFELFGAAFLRGHAVLRSDLVGIDQLLRKGR